MRSAQTPRKVIMEQLQAAHEHVRALESRTPELERTERFLRTVFEAAPDATAIVDQQGTFMLVNAHVEQLFGYSRDELLGQPFELLLPSKYPGVAPQDANGDGTGTPPGGLGRGEQRAIRKDGTEIFVDLTLSPIAIETGGLVVASIRDASAPRLERQALSLTATTLEAVGATDAFEAAVQVTLQSVCEQMDWPYGEAWVPSADRTVLECTPAWYGKGPAIREFRRLSETLRLPPATDLAGRAWTWKRPEWLPDLATASESLFPRREAALRAGLRAGMAAPIISDSAVVAVIQFLAPDPRTLGQHAFEAVSTVVNHLGTIAMHTSRTDQLRSDLRRQEMVLREVHHRVKNNLNAIAVLLSLQSARARNPETVSAVQESESRVRSVILLHDQLHRATDFGQIALAPYAKSLVGHLAHVHDANARGITMDVKSDEVFLPVDQAVPCGLIIQELVSNALKHAFPDGREGVVQIAVQLTGESRCQLSVADNGVGFPADLDFGNPTSLGLELVHNLTGQLNGSFQLETGRGCRFVVAFPVREPER